MNTKDYIEAAKQRLDLPSDYALAKVLGVAKQTVSNYQNGKTQLDEPIARRVAEILGIHPGLVLLDMQRERAKTPEDKSLWQEIYKGFLSLSLLAKSGGGFALPR
jgi:transcriptional regulator with XRE-family HTH domain